MSQSGFCCAYVFFIKENIADILRSGFGIDVNSNIFAIICFIGFTLLCFVRKIEIFAKTHVFADLMILLTVTFVVVYGCYALAEEGSRIKEVPFINSKTWADAIGFSVYSYEGIGVVLPV